MVFANFFLKSSWQVREFTPNTHVRAFVRWQRAKCGKAVAAQFVLARRHRVIQSRQLFIAMSTLPVLQDEKNRAQFVIGEFSTGPRFNHCSYIFHQLELLDVRFFCVVCFFLTFHHLEHLIHNVFI